MIPLKIAVAFGTRPEAIKLAPIIRALRRREHMAVTVVLTAQHRALLDQVLGIFGISADVDLDIMRDRQTLPELTTRLLGAFDEWLREALPDFVLVQGDATSTFIAALAAFYRGVPVGHVEAGLRTASAVSPFPEEMNRRLVSQLSMLHLAPTERARQMLEGEGIAPASIVVTGNPVIDALHEIRSSAAYQAAPLPITLSPGERLVLVTMHRRESWDRVGDVCAAIAGISEQRPAVRFVFPVHPNPAVRDRVHAALANRPRIHLTEPLDYVVFVKTMAASHLVLTDSGGVQEEAPVLGRPVLVLRDSTERVEALDAGVARLVGTDQTAITAAVLQLLDDEQAWKRMSTVVSPFGDGRAADRVADAIDARRRVIREYGSLPGNPRLVCANAMLTRP